MGLGIGDSGFLSEVDMAKEEFVSPILEWHLIQES
jgi:hypothetical protein